MEPGSTICYQPRRLVCLRVNCFYCNNESTFDIYIEYLFGLRACKNCLELAKRDIRAYLHKNKIVMVNDFNDNEVLKSFIDYVSEKKLRVKRSNGSIENDWTICSLDIMNQILFHFSESHNDWILPCANKDKSVSKNITLSSLKNPELEYDVEFNDLVDKVTKILNDGIYLKDFQSQPAEPQFYAGF